MERGLLLNVVVGESTTVFQLLSSEDETLLVRGNTLLVLDLALDVVDRVGRLNLKGDGLAGDLKVMLATCTANALEWRDSGVDDLRVFTKICMMG